MGKKSYFPKHIVFFYLCASFNPVNNSACSCFLLIDFWEDNRNKHAWQIELFMGNIKIPAVHQDFCLLINWKNWA